MKFANKIFTGLTLVLFACTTFSQPTYPAVSALFEAAMDSIDPPIPLVHPLFPYHLRDVAVCKGPDHHYYLTGTTDDNWGVADGIRVRKSKNLKDWELLGNDGFVWTFERDAYDGVDPVNGNYRLNAGSPAIGRGTADNAFPFDFEGQRRTIDFINLNNTVDIGFDEFIGQ